MKYDFKDWALGLLVAIVVMVAVLTLLVATKPMGWSLGRYALLFTAVLALFRLRRVQGKWKIFSV